MPGGSPFTRVSRPSIWLQPAVGMMAALRGAEVAAKPIDEATSQMKTVPDSLYQMAEVLFS